MLKSTEVTIIILILESYRRIPILIMNRVTERPSQFIHLHISHESSYGLYIYELVTTEQC